LTVPPIFCYDIYVYIDVQDLTFIYHMGNYARNSILNFISIQENIYYEHSPNIELMFFDSNPVELVRCLLLRRIQWQPAKHRLLK